MSALATVPTPLGPFTAVVDDEGAVLASGWTDDLDVLLAPVHAEIRPVDPARRTDSGAVTAAVAAFHDGDRAPAAAVPVRRISGPAIAAIREHLRAVPAGAPTTTASWPPRRATRRVAGWRRGRACTTPRRSSCRATGCCAAAAGSAATAGGWSSRSGCWRWSRAGVSATRRCRGCDPSSAA